MRTELPEELVVVHQAMLKVPGPLEAQHPQAGVAHGQQRMQVAHRRLGNASFLQRVQNHLSNGIWIMIGIMRR